MQSFTNMVKKCWENKRTQKLVNEIIDKMYERLADKIVSLIFWTVKCIIGSLFIMLLVHFIMR